jgi:uncharacterized protein YqhQ
MMSNEHIMMSEAPQAPSAATKGDLVQVGGMALRDGVLLQSETNWAAAVRLPDGTIALHSGTKKQWPGHVLVSRVPVMRGVMRLAESGAMLPRLRREAGVAILPQEDPRLLTAAAGSALGTLMLRRRGVRGPAVLRETAIAALSLAPALLALRSSDIARFHGAEHKSVAAYESGGPADAAAKEHERCGSNLVLPLMLTNLASGVVLRSLGKERRPLPVLVAGLVSIGSAVELFGWMVRHKGHPLADMLRAPGIELQRLFTTREPSHDQLDVAQAALTELLRVEGALVPEA